MASIILFRISRQRGFSSLLLEDLIHDFSSSVYAPSLSILERTSYSIDSSRGYLVYLSWLFTLSFTKSVW